MKDETDIRRFESTVTKAALCFILWQFSAMIFNVLCSAILNLATGGTINRAISTSIILSVTPIMSLLVVFPLLGRMLHLSLRSFWVGAKVDIKLLKLYIPVASTASAVGAYLITLPFLFLLQLIGVQSAPKMAIDYNNLPLPPMIIIIITTVFIGPLAEEVFTRGILLHILVPYGKEFAIVTTALLFSLGHSSFNQLFTTFLFGVVMAYVTLETGTIKNAFILHVINNGIAVIGQIIGLFSPQSGAFFIIATYVILGCIGIEILIKKKQVIHDSLNNELPEFIPIEHRVRKFICNPLMFLTLVILIIMLFSSIGAI